MWRSLVIILLSIVLVGCYNAADKPNFSTTIPEANTTIERLKEQYVGNRAIFIKDEVVVRGRITSSDTENNFYRTIIVDDQTAAIEVMVGLNALSKSYPEGLLVALNLQGCYVGESYGILQVGRKAESYSSYDVDYLDSREAADIVIRRSKDVEPIHPIDLNICDINKSHLGRLLRISDLQLVHSTSIDTIAGETLYDACWRGYSLFKSSTGDSIAIYTRNYATFADHTIPFERLSLTGILQYGKYNGAKECYQLKMRYEEDCQPY